MIGCTCEVCTSPDPRNQRTRTGIFIEAPQGNVLIDTSPELRLQLVREKIKLIHAALFTHGHADHIFGLDDLRLFGHYLKSPVAVYCEDLVEERLRASFDYAFPDFNHPYAGNHMGAVPMLDVRRITLEPFDVLGLKFQPIRLMHGRLPILGFRFANVAFCTDVSRIPEESWPLLEGLDVLILGALRYKPHPTHFSVDQALEVVRRVRPRQTYFTHISHALDHSATNAKLTAGVELAYDGLRINY
jgi:phosphoribosyl 1,2-cyclic phosphate phosphodiesterase